MIRNCRACSTFLGEVEPDEFQFCSFCGSANYVSETSAEEDNQKYFDSIFRDSDQSLNPQKIRYFERFRHQHFKLFNHQERNFQAFLAKISSAVIGAKKSVEVGFGSGDEFLKFLKAGADIYGLDISREAVKSFKMRYPEHADRVACGTRPHFPVELVYSNAFLEHLDEPGEFLSMASSSLYRGGLLVMRLPIISVARKRVNDINLWKPCHRALYTIEGLEILLNRFGFTITASASLACYSYKVMNRMLDLGYDEIIHHRNPCRQIKGLESNFNFLMILFSAFFRKTMCSDFAFIARSKR